MGSFVVVELVLCLGTLGSVRQESVVEERENLSASERLYLEGEAARAFDSSVRAAKSASARANGADTGQAAHTAV
jgi:septal ring-binding cell division protein DamX